jgi:hypothetical protein
LSDQDIVACYLLIYLRSRYSNDFLTNYNEILPLSKTKRVDSCSYKKVLHIDEKNGEQNKLKKFKCETLFDIINSFNLHSVPYSARCSLVNWYTGAYDLILCVNKIPTSLDVLRMQANRQRCVSLIYDKLDSLVMNERDPLSFLLHDLVHSYKMFSNQYLLNGQIGFSRAILKIYEDKTKRSLNLLNELLNNDSKFANEFDYLISDMNSHTRHLFSYFKAILINAFKTKHKIAESSFLVGDSLLDFKKTFNELIDVFEMNESQRLVARNLLMNEKEPSNAQTSQDDFSLLEDYFLSLAE